MGRRFVEEPAKLLATVVVAGSIKYRYRLNGMLSGAAVGTGFAVFETLQYVFISERALEVLFYRGILSPFCHIPWSAIAGWALWEVKGDLRLRLYMLFDSRFLRIFIFPVILHVIWNLIPSLYIFIPVGITVWMICFILVNDGLQETHIYKN